MVSIKQNVYPDVLPDFRNLGVIARILLGVNAAALAGALFASPDLRVGLERFVTVAAFVEPLLFIELVALFILSRWMARLPYWSACAAIVLLATLLAAIYHAALQGLPLPPESMTRTVLLCAIVTAALL